MWKFYQRLRTKEFVTFIGRGLCVGSVYQVLLFQIMELSSQVLMWSIFEITWKYKLNSYRSFTHRRTGRHNRKINYYWRGSRKNWMIPRDYGRVATRSVLVITHHPSLHHRVKYLHTSVWGGHHVSSQNRHAIIMMLQFQWGRKWCRVNMFLWPNWWNKRCRPHSRVHF